MLRVMAVGESLCMQARFLTTPLVMRSLDVWIHGSKDPQLRVGNFFFFLPTEGQVDSTADQEAPSTKKKSKTVVHLTGFLLILRTRHDHAL